MPPTSSTAAAQHHDIIVLGAGAAGLMAAATAGQRGRRVLLLDHAIKLAEKIRISGGGRCNFTHLHARAECYLSDNPHFCRSALAQYTPQDFLALVEKHHIRWHEKSPGQLFCGDANSTDNGGSECIIAILDHECQRGQVDRRMNVSIHQVRASTTPRFLVDTSIGNFSSDTLIIATGGLAIPQIGASPLGYRLAKQFGLPVTPLAPALVPLTFHVDDVTRFAPLAGLSLPIEVRCGKAHFRDAMLFTHKGLSGPAILQISSYWTPGQTLDINLLPGTNLNAHFEKSRAMKLGNALAALHLPRRFNDIFLANLHLSPDTVIAQLPQQQRTALAHHLHHWTVLPNGTQGYKKAEVTRGGIDTRALDSKTMQCKNVPSLFFAGEVIDVTGWLGGYNLQWAWSSGYVAGANA